MSPTNFSLLTFAAFGVTAWDEYFKSQFFNHFNLIIHTSSILYYGKCHNLQGYQNP